MNFIIEIIRKLLGIKPKYVPSKDMQEFYWALQAWIEQGMYEHAVLKTNRGLCACMYYWARLHNLDNLAMQAELLHSFRRAKLHGVVPFNSKDPDDPHSYHQEVIDHTIFNNPKRLAWVRKYSQ